VGGCGLEITMKKLKIYLDTSVISHLQAYDVPEKMAKTLKFWESLVDGDYEAYISELVIAEFKSQRNLALK
jgi:predicted nucleic acid-binding protein